MKKGQRTISRMAWNKLNALCDAAKVEGYTSDQGSPQQAAGAEEAYNKARSAMEDFIYRLESGRR